MASKPTVTLTLAGDEKKLTEAFDNVSTAAQRMETEIESTSDGFRQASRSADDWAESSDNVDTRAMGFRDTLTGVQDGLAGLRGEGENTFENLLLIGYGVGDLASGFTNLLIPAMATFWTWLTSTSAATWLVTAAKTAWAAITGVVTTVMTALNAVIRANPIMFLVGLIAVLVAAFLALWTRSEGFRNFFIGMWNGIKTVVGGVVSWIVNAWNGVVDFFRNFPDRIGAALGSLGGIISSVFKGAVNIMIDGLNWGIDRINDLIYGANLVNPFSDIPSIPKIGRLHTGGVVPGMIGSEQLAILQAGERVVPRGQGSNTNRGPWVVGAGADGKVAELINYLIRTGEIPLPGGVA